MGKTSQAPIAEASHCRRLLHRPPVVGSRRGRSLVPAGECPGVRRPPWWRSWLRSYSSVHMDPSHLVWMRRRGWYQRQPPGMSLQVPIFARGNVSNVFFNIIRVLSISSADSKESESRGFPLKNMLLQMSTVRNYERGKRQTSSAVNQRINMGNA